MTTPPLLFPGDRVHVYRNLTRACWSVRRSGRVIAHVRALHLQDCRMVVQAGGQARARVTGQRNVHAYVSGVVTLRPAPGVPVRVRYDPFLMATFQEDTGAAIHGSPAAHFDETGRCWVTGPRP